MARKPYTIENNRPRRTVTLYGRTLAPRGTGRTSILDLTADEFSDLPCQRLLRLNRIRILREPEEPATLVAEVPAPEEEAPTLSLEAAAVHEERKNEILELQETPPEVDSEPPPVDSAEAGEADGTTPPSPYQDTTRVWTEAELKELKAAEQKLIVESRGLDGGTNAQSRIQAILDAQEGV